MLITAAAVKTIGAKWSLISYAPSLSTVSYGETGIQGFIDNLFSDYRVGLIFLGLLLLLALMTILLFVLSYRRTKEWRLISQELQIVKKEKASAEEKCDELQLAKTGAELRIDELRKSREQLAKIAYNDYLTGLPNRNAMIDMLDGTMATLRSGEQIAVARIDISDFKEINSSLGFPHGDELLIDAAHRLQSVLSSSDCLIRSGADEFTIISQNASKLDEYEVKLELIKNIFRKPFTLATKECFISVNIGIAFAPTDGNNTALLLKNVELALYTAQERGDNTYCYFDSSIQHGVLKKMELQAEIKRAIDENQFEILYTRRKKQAQEALPYLEAVLQWNHPTRGAIPYSEFFPFSEDSGLIIQIAMFAFEEICRYIHSWTNASISYILMNLSVRELRDAEFIDFIEKTLFKYEIDPKTIEFSISEKKLINNLDTLESAINRLNRMGIMLSICEFGEGFSTLNYLSRLHVDKLKFSSDFLSTMLDSASDRKTLELIIHLSKAMNIHSIEVDSDSEAEFDINELKSYSIIQNGICREPMPAQGMTEAS